jgi:hypothetical protein
MQPQELSVELAPQVRPERVRLRSAEVQLLSRLLPLYVGLPLRAPRERPGVQDRRRIL